MRCARVLMSVALSLAVSAASMSSVAQATTPLKILIGRNLFQAIYVVFTNNAGPTQCGTAFSLGWNLEFHQPPSDTVGFFSAPFDSVGLDCKGVPIGRVSDGLGPCLNGAIAGLPLPAPTPGLTPGEQAQAYFSFLVQEAQQCLKVDLSAALAAALPPVLIVPHWLQAGIPELAGYPDPGNLWGILPYDSTEPPSTIRAKGCALTALTIVANFWAGHVNDPTGFSTLDPGKINNWNGLYCKTDTCRGDVQWNVFATVPNNPGAPIVRLYTACPLTNPQCSQNPPNNSFPVFSDPALTLGNILRNNVPVILQIFVKNRTDAIHFVVATGGAANGDFIINDPGDRFSTTLNNLQKASWVHPGEQLDIARILDPSNYIVYVSLDPATAKYKALVRKDPSTAQALGVYSSAPVEFVLTDPQGRRTGFDPVTNTSFQEIPTSAYSSTLYRDDQNLSAPDPPPFKALDMANQVVGQYTLNVIGTGSGDFTVEVVASDAAGNWIAQTYTGTTAPGVTSRFTFLGGVVTFADFGARLEIKSAPQAFEVKGTFALGSGGTVSPLTQPVTILLGNAVVTIPAGSFRQTPQGKFVFDGIIDGIALEATLTPTGGNSYAFKIEGAGAPKLPDANPVDVRLAIGNNGGSTSVTAEFGP